MKLDEIKQKMIESIKKDCKSIIEDNPPYVLYFSQNIPSRVEKKLRKKIDQYLDFNKVLAFLDISLLNSTKKGILFLTDRAYFLDKKLFCIRYENINNVGKSDNILDDYFPQIKIDVNCGRNTEYATFGVSSCEVQTALIKTFNDLIVIDGVYRLLLGGQLGKVDAEIERKTKEEYKIAQLHELLLNHYSNFKEYIELAFIRTVFMYEKGFTQEKDNVMYLKENLLHEVIKARKLDKTYTPSKTVKWILSSYPYIEENLSEAINYAARISKVAYDFDEYTISASFFEKYSDIIIEDKQELLGNYASNYNCCTVLDSHHNYTYYLEESIINKIIREMYSFAVEKDRLMNSYGFANDMELLHYVLKNIEHVIDEPIQQLVTHSVLWKAMNQSLIKNHPDTDPQDKKVECIDTEENSESEKLESENTEKEKWGEQGEKNVEYQLKWLGSNYTIIERHTDCNGKNGIVLFNPDISDETQEIDHIIVSQHGVFLIESKYYRDKIIIQKNGNWKRQYSDGREKGIISPVLQVDRHHMVVSSILKGLVCEEDIHDIICISHNSAILVGEENCAVKVLKVDNLIRYIKEFHESSYPIDVEAVIKRIDQFRAN